MLSTYFNSNDIHIFLLPIHSELECPSEFELVGGECVAVLSKREKYKAAKEKCDRFYKGAQVLMLKTKEFSDAIIAWDKVASA